MTHNKLMDISINATNFSCFNSFHWPICNRTKRKTGEKNVEFHFAVSTKSCIKLSAMHKPKLCGDLICATINNDQIVAFYSFSLVTTI